MAPRVLAIGQVQSDGIRSNRPAKDLNLIPCDHYFREKIAEKWASDRKDIIDKKNVILDRLPDGYACFEKRREHSEKHHIDRWVYGHSSGVFRSVPTFYKHFKHLMDNGSAAGCSCERCAVPGRRQSSVHATSQPSKHRSLDNIQVSKRKLPQGDEDDPNHDVIQVRKKQKLAASSDHACHSSVMAQQQLATIKKSAIGQYSKFFTELARSKNDEISYQDLHHGCIWPWQALTFANSIADALHETHYIPRCGELVLFMDLLSTPKTMSWQAALVRGSHVTTSSSSTNLYFRLQEMEASDSPYRHVHSHHVRPMHFWRLLLPNTPITALHPSIRAALTSTSSASLLAPYSLRPFNNESGSSGTVYCHGAYIGPELLARGDMIHFLSDTSDIGQAVDVMQITRIKLKLWTKENGQQDHCLHIVGIPYTSQPSRSYGGYARHPVSVTGLTSKNGAQWYRVLDPTQPQRRLEIPYALVVGRYYGVEKMTTWFQADGLSAKKGLIDTEILRGLSLAAKYSADAQKHIWRWDMSRREQLRSLHLIPDDD